MRLHEILAEDIVSQISAINHILSRRDTSPAMRELAKSKLRILLQRRKAAQQAKEEPPKKEQPKAAPKKGVKPVEWPQASGGWGKFKWAPDRAPKRGGVVDLTV
jgi:hypothetical protein